MQLNFIELWADQAPSYRWHVVIAGLVLTILAASSLDFYSERAEFLARCKARKHELVTLKTGDLACRAPRGSRT